MTDPRSENALRLALASSGSGALGPVRQRLVDETVAVERGARLAADNLVEKALRRVREGDEPAARRFVERALALRLDEGAVVPAAAIAAHLLAWEAVRAAAVAGAPDWDGRATTVLGGLDGPVRTEWAAVLASVDEDLEEEGLAGAAAGVGDPRHEPLEDVPPSAHTDVLLGLLAALVAFERR